MAGLGLMPPFVHVGTPARGMPPAFGFPVFGAALRVDDAVTRLEAIDRLPHGGGFNLHADQPTIDVEVRLRQYPAGHRRIAGCSPNLT